MTGANDGAMQIGLFGAGRLGSAIASVAGAQVVWQVTREVPPAARVDVAIEASSGKTVPERLLWAIATHTPLVIGSTGWELPDLKDRVAGRIGVVVAPNFSLGVALLRRFALVLARFCAADPARDPYLVEHHHSKKHDAPSGTAKLLAQTLLGGCPRKREWVIGGPLRDDQLAVAVIRAGTNYSEHTIGMDAPAEVIELTHRARSAAAYAQGALAAARFVRHKKGIFAMEDVARAELEPLFADLHGGSR